MFNADYSTKKCISHPAVCYLRDILIIRIFGLLAARFNFYLFTLEMPDSLFRDGDITREIALDIDNAMNDNANSSKGAPQVPFHRQKRR